MYHCTLVRLGFGASGTVSDLVSVVYNQKVPFNNWNTAPVLEDRGAGV